MPTELPYQDPALSSEQRAEDLLSRMSLKTRQASSCTARSVWVRGASWPMPPPRSAYRAPDLSPEAARLL